MIHRFGARGFSSALVSALAAAALSSLIGCGASAPAPAASPAPAPAPTAEPALAAPAASPAPAPAPAAAASSAAPAASAAPVAAEPVVSSTTVSNEITTPNVVTPDRVIASLRPKFNTCYQDGLKKAPKLEGSVTLSAKIDKDGKVAAVTPKMATGLNPAVIKCLSDQVKAASFAPAGGMSYATSLDIPVGFSSH